MTESNRLIHIENLEKSYDGLKVLNGISLDINKGEVVVILGPSGCGKSTFLRCLNLLEVPDSGHIYIDDTEITSPKTNIDEQRQKMMAILRDSFSEAFKNTESDDLDDNGDGYLDERV